MVNISSEAKVGLFVLVGLIILGYMSFRVGQQGFGLKNGYTVRAVFPNVAGLDRDASVQIAGVEIGRVEEIQLQDGQAVVTLRIRPNVKLGNDAAATIKTHGVLGDKYIELVPGTNTQAFLKEGEQIQRVESQADIDRLLRQITLIAADIRGVTSSLNKAMGGERGEASLGEIVENARLLTKNLNALVVNNEEALRFTLGNARQMTDNLNRVVVTNDAKIADVMDNLKDASKQMEQTFAQLNEITGSINRGEGSLGQLVKNQETAQKLNQTMTSLQEVSDKINQGKGTIGKLINDEQTARNLDETIKGINRYVSKSEQFRTYLNYRGEYLFDKSDGKSYVDIRIQPKEDRYYLVGVVADPRGRRTVKERITNGVMTRTEEWEKDGLLFNAQVAKRFRNVVLRGGVLESTGGVGLDYLMLNDRLKLSFEAFDFNSDDDDRAHLKAGMEFQVFKHIYLTAGWDDFISKRSNSSPFAGFAIRFEDDDLKYLLSSVPIPK
jgi:phospholipid/cholesterol/gamma-HCH transport system substrate-binding protein